MKTRKFNFEGKHAPEPGSRVARLAALRQRRAAKALADLKRWQSKFKRARRMVSKLKTRVKYYDGLIMVPAVGYVDANGHDFKGKTD